MYQARTDRLISFSGSRTQQWNPSVLGQFMAAALFFCAHDTYVDRLEKVWADGIVSLYGWQNLLSSLLSEWSDSNLLATVTLSANMAFLALAELKDIAKTASTVSTFFAIGSIIIGVHHVWRHRVKVGTDAEHAGNYFQNATRTMGSLKPLAVFLSLPLILLSWALITLTFSVACYAFDDARLPSSYIVMGVILFVVVGVTAATVLFFWEIFRAQCMCAQNLNSPA